MNARNSGPERVYLVQDNPDDKFTVIRREVRFKDINLRNVKTTCSECGQDIGLYGGVCGACGVGRETPYLERIEEKIDNGVPNLPNVRTESVTKLRGFENFISTASIGKGPTAFLGKGISCSEPLVGGRVELDRGACANVVVAQREVLLAAGSWANFVCCSGKVILEHATGSDDMVVIAKNLRLTCRNFAREIYILPGGSVSIDQIGDGGVIGKIIFVGEGHPEDHSFLLEKMTKRIESISVEEFENRFQKFVSSK